MEALDQICQTSGALSQNNKSKEYESRKFLDFVKTPKNNKELKSEFPGKTWMVLKKRLKRLNLITVHGDFCVITPPHSEPTLDEFWNVLLQIYKEMQKGDRHMYYIPIGELRNRISCKFGFTNKDIFDQYLVKIFEHEEYRKIVRLHGGPTHAYDKLYNFKFNEKLYLLLSMVNYQ